MNFCREKVHSIYGNPLQPKLTPKDEDFRDMRQDLFNTSVLRNNFKIFRRKKEGDAFGRVGPVLKMLC